MEDKQIEMISFSNSLFLQNASANFIATLIGIWFLPKLQYGLHILNLEWIYIKKMKEFGITQICKHFIRICETGFSRLFSVGRNKENSIKVERR